VSSVKLVLLRQEQKMKRKRRNHLTDFKAKVAVAALREIEPWQS
jgi:hypothetical protein